MMITASCEQGTTEWQQARCGVVTASNFKLVLTKGKGKTRKAYMMRLIEEKRTGRPTESYWSDAMKRGTDLEPRARKAYETTTGNGVKEVGINFLDERRRVGASPDGLIDHDGGLEIKCPLVSTHTKYLQSGRIPAQYVPQVQGNLWVSGREWWDFASFAPEMPPEEQIVIYRAYRDEDYISRLKSEVEQFVEELDQIIGAI